MKALLIFLGTFLLSLSSVQSQDFNWANIRTEDKHILSAEAAWDYALGFGLGYAYRPSTQAPLWLTAGFSFPSGEKLLDDFKTKVGGQIRVAQAGNFQVIASVQGIYRRYESQLVRLQNLGLESRVMVGYYHPKWFVGGELGFDWAIATQFRHSEEFRQNTYAKLQDGWAASPTGGNFAYGLQGGYSFGRNDLVLKIGGLASQGLETAPMIPLYAQFSFNFEVGKAK
ncbi:hypothetical protein GCM10009119_08570 [Algoriphagus jejuensis]|uniref:Outer membrane protein with beta-barrel domain n=1 Tax=Algoriphagus jejuensis TaxID=419934 RepID=A0ABN1MXL7_9BACT